MIQAASHGSLSLLKQFVKWGADLNAPDMTDRWHPTPISHLKQFVKWGADPNAPDMTNRYHPTALSQAAQGGHLEMVRFILEHGVEVNAKAGRWSCALGAAARWGKIEVAECLLIHGADPNVHDDILNYAVYGGLEIVKMLIDKGANLQVLGEAALESASGSGNLGIVKLLIEKGVSPKKGQILQVACYCGNLEVVKVLVENAIDSDEKEVVEFLIQSGADVNATGDNSKTPLQLAIQEGYKEIEDILRRHGARE
ncbi:ankyrin repeat-containing domain protein [Mycena floridula]|nr:ankyrin repeat-containing domain protein [Mycena floridula]